MDLLPADTNKRYTKTIEKVPKWIIIFHFGIFWQKFFTYFLEKDLVDLSVFETLRRFIPTKTFVVTQHFDR